MTKLFISTTPFGVSDPSILEPLVQSGIDWSQNSSKRNLKTEELLEYAKDCDILVAGTDNLMPLININPNLKFISRVGIGLDGVPLNECKRRGIRVSWTPDAVTQGVAELTLGLMICSTRFVRSLDTEIRCQGWSRLAGIGIRESVIGLIGFGRIGLSVAQLLLSFQPQELLVCDLLDKSMEINNLRSEGMYIRSVFKEELIKKSNIISLHVPLYKATHHLIGKKEFNKMLPDSVLINTARGGIVDEDALNNALNKKKLAAAAIDAFEKEPYFGPLTKQQNCLLTPHVGSCTHKCRIRMESEALNEALRWYRGEKLKREVPKEQYSYQE